MKKNKVGRPTKINDKLVKKLEEAFLLDATIDEACFMAKITKPTYYVLIEKNPDILTRFESCRNNPVLLARKTVINGIKDNPELALKYLERKRKLEFSTKQELGVTDKDGNDIIPKLTPEQLKNIGTEMLKITGE